MNENKTISELLINLIKDKHAITISDLLVDYINNELIEEEREEIKERITL
jgi:hypothetical protein